MGRQRIVIGRKLMPEFFRGHEMSSVESNLPKDATLVYASMELATGNVVFVMESEEWPETLEGSTLMDFDLRYTKYESELSWMKRALKL